MLYDDRRLDAGELRALVVDKVDCQRIIVRVEDEGEGFDHAAYRARLGSGGGVAMARERGVPTLLDGAQAVAGVLVGEKVGQQLPRRVLRRYVRDLLFYHRSIGRYVRGLLFHHRSIGRYVRGLLLYRGCLLSLPVHLVLDTHGAQTLA